MKLFDTSTYKNLLLYLTLPHFIKIHFLTNDDKVKIREINQAWNLKVNAGSLSDSYDKRHGYLSSEGSGYPLIPLLEHRLNRAQSFGKVLEIGAGSGFVTVRLAEQSERWTALELVPVLAERIKKLALEQKLHQVRALEESIFHAEFPDSEFDTIFFFYTLHHMTDRDILLQKICRWLKPGGILYCLDPRHNLLRVMQLVRKYVTMYRHHKSDDLIATHDFLSVIELKTLLKKAGFGKAKVESFDFPYVSKLTKRNRLNQFALETKLNKIPIVEHLGRFVFAAAVK